MMGSLPGRIGSLGHPLGLIRPIARHGSGLPAEARTSINWGDTAQLIEARASLSVRRSVEHLRLGHEQAEAAAPDSEFAHRINSIQQASPLLQKLILGCGVEHAQIKILLQFIPEV